MLRFLGFLDLRMCPPLAVHPAIHALISAAEPSSAPQADAPDADADMDQDGPSRKKKRRRKKDGGSAGGMGEGVQAEELLHGASGRVWTFPELDGSLHRVRVSSGDAHVVAAGGRAGLVILRCMPKVK